MKRLIQILFSLLILFPIVASAQKESDDIRAGNRLYNSKKYTESEIEYRKALQKNNKSFEANYNLGNSLFRQGKYKEAFEQYKTALPYATDKKKTAAEFHNIGNTFMAGGQFQDAIGAYKMALKVNPKDDDTRYNLAYAQAMLKKQQQNPNDNNKDKDKNNDKDRDKDKKQDPKQDQDKNKPQEQPQPQQPQMSKENAQQILDALEQDEKDAMDKAKKGQVRSGRKVEKDW